MFCSSSFHQHSQQQQKHQRCCCYLQRMSQKPCRHQRCCCEFMPSPTATSDDPASIKCDACGCHQNFHRCEPEEPISTVFEYQPHHRHHPPPPPLFQSRSPSSPSPPPISSYPSAPHMLLALSGAGVGLSIPPENTAAPLNLGSPMGASRKRFRTKFTQDQKEKMHEFAERVRWKMQKRDEEMVNGFCNEVGVDRSVLKVWMHNNKNTLGRKLSDHGDGDGAAVRSTDDGVSGGGFGVHENDNNGINVAACARLTLSCVEGGRSMFGSSSQGICLPYGLHQATSASQMPSGVCF